MSVDNTSPTDRFAFKLFRELTRGREASNVFFSPFSVMLCLLMLWEGASGSTREAIGGVLEIAAEAMGPSQQELRATKVRQILGSALGIRERGLELAIANSLWCSEQFALNEAYRSEMEKRYAAEILAVPMPSRETVARINAWVREKTRGKITSILESLDPITRLVALNAIYFKGLWEEPFDKQLTRVKPFHADGSPRPQVPLMHRGGEFPYCEHAGLQAVRLPYRGWRVGMYVILPAKDSSLPALLGDATSVEWAGWLAGMDERQGIVELPRFKFESGARLTETLSGLGMAEAFDSTRARFDGISPAQPPLFLREVIHRALVEVNEEGTEAAATTVMALGETSAMRPRTPLPPFVMIVDRPFFFAIRDDQSGTILFMGSVNNPS